MQMPGELYYGTAVEFREAYLALQADTRQMFGFEAAKPYLLCHALELTLKGCLVHTDQSKYTDELLKKKFGHNLQKFAKEVEKECRSFHQELINCLPFIQLVGKDWDIEYRYPGNGTFSAPRNLDAFYAAVNELIVALSVHIFQPAHL
jgi:hypothetical protein